MMYEDEYRRLIRNLLKDGVPRETRTGKVIALFNTEIEARLGSELFPLLTGRYMNFDIVRAEAEWMLSGSTNVKDLHPVKIWDKWADENGDLGPTYGAQLKKQWQPILKLIWEDWTTRRALINLWNVSELSQMKLPPCYYSLQFYCKKEKELSMKVGSRSSDVAVGLPYDIAVLSYLLIKASWFIGFKPGSVVMSLTDYHINEENIPAMEEYLHRNVYYLPEFKLYTGGFIQLGYYRTSGPIKMVVKP